METPSSVTSAAAQARSAPVTHATVDSVTSETAIAAREKPSACSVPTSRTRDEKAAYIAWTPPSTPPVEIRSAVARTSRRIGAKNSASCA